jgi:5'-deoxynucleotidase YfbR-like HD superfamily hydrolase
LDGTRKNKLETLALHHDIAEVKTGDVPTPTKKHIEEKTDALERYELEAYPQYIVFKNSVVMSDPVLIHILKMADLIEAIYFLEEEGIGQHASEVKSLLASQLAEIHTLTKEDDRYKHENLDPIWEIFTELCPKWTLY